MKSRPAPRVRRAAAVRPHIEELEARLALTVSASVMNGQLLVTGDNTGNAIALDHIGTNTVVNGRSFADAAITAGIEIDSGTGDDTVVIHQTVKPVTVNGQGGFDDVSVGLRGDLQAILAPLTIANVGGGTALTVDGSAATFPQNVTLTRIAAGRAATSTITGLAPATITYADEGFRSLTLDGGSSGNTFIVADTFVSLFVAANTTLNTGTGNDLVTVEGTTGALVIDGVGGSDTVNVGLSGKVQGITGELTVGSSGGVLSLNVNDQADTTQNVQVTLGTSGANTGTITGLSPAPITYTSNGVHALTINGGSGGNAFTVADTLAGVTTTLNTGTNDDNVVVQATHGPLFIDGQIGFDFVQLGQGGSVQAILGAVTVADSQGRTDLVVDDQADGIGHNVTLADGAATAGSAATSTITGLSQGVITYVDSGVNTLTINGGSGGNTFTVADTFLNQRVAGTSTTVNTGAGADKVNVRGTSGPLVIKAAAGNDTINVGSTANTLDTLQGPLTVDGQTDTDTLNINDQGSTRSPTYQTTATTVDRSGAATITFANIENVQLNRANPVPPAPPPVLATPRDVTSLVKVIRGRPRFDPTTGQTLLKLTIHNLSGQALNGPLTLVLDNLRGKVRLLKRSGTTTKTAPVGSPFIGLSPASGLAANASLNVVLRFRNPLNGKVLFTPQVLAGLGAL